MSNDLDWVESDPFFAEGMKAGRATVERNPTVSVDNADVASLNPLSLCQNCGLSREAARWASCMVDYQDGYPVWGDHSFVMETIEYPGARSLIRAHLWHEHNELVRSFGSPFVPLSRTEWTTTFLTQPPEKFVAEVCPVRGLFVEAA